MSTTIAGELQALIDGAYHDINRHIADRLAAEGFADVRAAHGKVFEQMARHSRVKDMAESANVTKQAMGELVAQLEDAGYLQRVEDPKDRRAKVVRLTAKGRRCVTAADKILSDLHATWAAEIGPLRLATAVAVLRAIRPTPTP